jgi:hypothetical protein
MDLKRIRLTLDTIRDQIAELEQLLTVEEKTLAKPESVQGPLYGINPTEVGLHILKEKWCRKSYIKAHCDELLKAGVFV